jgi:hypothetical protein
VHSRFLRRNHNHLARSSGFAQCGRIRIPSWQVPICSCSYCPQVRAA